MKLILSRKGFDSAAGGFPSPIMPDGPLLSLPIPIQDNICYSNLKFTKDVSYFEIISQLKPKVKINGKWILLTKETKCHLDPDLIPDIYPRKPGWKPIFGQIDAAQSHLEKNNVREGDLFLFFGLFQETEYIDGALKFKRNSKPIHVIFGYFEIDKIHLIQEGTNVPDWMLYHPHVADIKKWRRKKPTNTIYEAKEHLSFNQKFPGACTFKYDSSLVLTKKDCSASKWNLPDCFKNVNITYHSNSKKYGWKEDCFYSASRGQEFIIEGNKEIERWAKELILMNLNK